MPEPIRITRLRPRLLPSHRGDATQEPESLHRNGAHRAADARGERAVDLLPESASCGRLYGCARVVERARRALTSEIERSAEPLRIEAECRRISRAEAELRCILCADVRIESGTAQRVPERHVRVLFRIVLALREQSPGESVTARGIREQLRS